MRSEIEKENEWYFGLQEHSTAESAFNVIEGDWSDIHGDGDFTKIMIMTDESFAKVIRSRALDCYLNYRAGEISRDRYRKCVGLHPHCINDYLVDFDFFLWSKKLDKFYTNRATFGDDGCNEWNNRQWSYFDTLNEAFDFPTLVAEAQEMADRALKMMGIKKRDKINDEIIGGVFDTIQSEDGGFDSDKIMFF